MAKRYDKDWSAGPDSDGDGLSDRFETVVLGTDPHDWDSDGDTLSDKREKDFGSDPKEPDSDGDGVWDGREVTVGTSPFMDDTDGDNVKDRDEIVAGTAHAPDEDGDGTADWVQSVRGADMDGDGLTDGEEMWLGTNVLSANSDGDDIDDLQETQFGGDLGRSPSVFDGRRVPQIPDGPFVDPNGPGQPPDIDTSPPGTVPEAMLDFEEPADDVALLDDHGAADGDGDLDLLA
jgi:hypothetical protein